MASAKKIMPFAMQHWHVNNVIRDIEKSGSFRNEKPDEIRKEGFWDYYSSHDEGWPRALPLRKSGRSNTRPQKSSWGFAALAILVFVNMMKDGCINPYSPCRGNGQKPQEIPDDIPNVIVTLEPMDQELIKTVPSALSGGGNGPWLYF